MIPVVLCPASPVPGMIWEHKGIEISEAMDLGVLQYYSALNIYHENLPAFLLVRCAKVPYQMVPNLGHIQVVMSLALQ